MPRQPDNSSTFAGVGEVIEILEGAGPRRAKVLLESGLLLDVTAESVVDVHLGDRVVIEGSIVIERLRAADADAAPARRT